MSFRNKAVGTMWSMLVLMAAIPLAFEFGRAFEGDIFPVVRDVTVGFDGHNVSASFNKVRPCEFIDLIWFDGKTWTPAKFTDTWSRPVGPSIGVKWSTFPYEGPDNMKIVVRHNCHPLWDTETTFFKSKGAS